MQPCVTISPIEKEQPIAHNQTTISSHLVLVDIEEVSITVTILPEHQMMTPFQKGIVKLSPQNAFSIEYYNI